MKNGRLFVGNLGESITNEQLADLFAEFGKVLRVNTVITQEGRGLGLVEMSNYIEARKAQQVLNGTSFEGNSLICVYPQYVGERGFHEESEL